MYGCNATPGRARQRHSVSFRQKSVGCCATPSGGRGGGDGAAKELLHAISSSVGEQALLTHELACAHTMHPRAVLRPAHSCTSADVQLCKLVVSDPAAQPTASESIWHGRADACGNAQSCPALSRSR